MVKNEQRSNLMMQDESNVGSAAVTFSQEIPLHFSIAQVAVGKPSTHRQMCRNRVLQRAITECVTIILSRGLSLILKCLCESIAIMF